MPWFLAFEELSFWRLTFGGSSVSRQVPLNMKSDRNDAVFEEAQKQARSTWSRLVAECDSGIKLSDPKVVWSVPLKIEEKKDVDTSAGNPNPHDPDPTAEQ